MVPHFEWIFRRMLPCHRLGVGYAGKHHEFFYYQRPQEPPFGDILFKDAILSSDFRMNILSHFRKTDRCGVRELTYISTNWAPKVSRGGQF